MRQDLIFSILDWGYARGLHDTKDLKPQMTKLTEELGEIAAGVARDDHAQIIDGVGDLLVVLINFGAVFAHASEPTDTEDRNRLENNFLETCLSHAWEQIKDRQGHTRDGVFIKDTGE